MNIETQAVMDECTRASDDERITFPEVVKKLMQGGVERYHADLIRAEKIYYLPGGESHRTPCDAVTAKVPQAFSAAGVETAVRAIQRIRAVSLGDDDAKLLDVAPGVASLHVERTSYLASGRVVEFTRSIYRGDTYDFVAELRLGDRRP